jgi:hypothetical protein
MPEDHEGDSRRKEEGHEGDGPPKEADQEGDGPPKEDLLRALQAILKEKPALGVTALYLYISLLGSTYQWALFSRFDLNYFDFAEVNDFLTAAFREPVIVLFSMGYLVGGVWFLRMLGRPRARRPHDRWISWFRTSWLTRGQAVVVIIMSVAAPGLQARWRGRNMNQGWGTYAHVQLSRQPDSLRTFPVDELMLLGTTDRFVFFFHHPTEMSYIVPVANIAWKSVCTTPAPLYKPLFRLPFMPPLPPPGETCDP